MDFTSDGEFELTNFRNPPGKPLNPHLLSRSRFDMTGIKAESAGVTSTIGVNFSSLNFLAEPSLSNMMIIGHGSRWIRWPM